MSNIDLHQRSAHVPPIGPTFYVTQGTRVVIEDILASRYRDFLYFAAGGGQSHVRRIHGWGYGRYITVENMEDVISFDTIRYVHPSVWFPYVLKPSALIHAASLQGNFIENEHVSIK